MRSIAWLSLLACACITPPLVTCPSDRAYCAGECVDLASDALHCGACDTACGGTSPMCSAGRCDVQGCASSLTDCAGACVDLDTSAAHCGACGNACGAHAACIPGPAGSACLCEPGFLDVGGACTACRACTASEFLVAACTPVSDTQCAPLTECGSAQFQVAPPTPTSNRVCMDCAAISNCQQLTCTTPFDSSCSLCDPGFNPPTCMPTVLPPAPDCLAVLQANLSMGDGLYMVDPDGPGPAPTVQTYCDMVNGGWTLMNDQDVNVAPGYQSAATWRAGVSTTGPNGGQWGILPMAPAFMSIGGGFDLRLTFGQDTTSSVVSWHQTGDPSAGMRGVLSAVVMTPASQASCAGPFVGVADDGVTSSAWAGETGCGLAFSVGTSAAVGGGIPAYDNSAAGALITDRVRLWIRIVPP